VPIAEDDRPVRLASVPRPDASIDAPSDAAPADASVSAGANDGSRAKVSELVDVKSPGTESTPLGDMTVEDGIPVIHVKKRMWCARGGKFDHFCAAEKVPCAKMGKCHQVDAMACTQIKNRMTGDMPVFCFDSLNMCEAFRDQAEQQADVGDISVCAVMRYTK
jgi:hypothetical protein